MSNPVTKAERSKAKDIRQGVTAQRERPNKKKKKEPRPFKVMAPAWRFSKDKKPWCIHRSATRVEAEHWIAKVQRSHPGLAEDKYWIEGPDDENQ